MVESANGMEPADTKERRRERGCRQSGAPKHMIFTKEVSADSEELAVDQQRPGCSSSP